MMKKRTRVKLLCFLFSTFLLAGSILPSFTSAAAGDCEEWYARTGLIDKSGDNENGYTIGSRGDSGYSLARLDKKFDVLATEIQFSFKAYPTDGVSNEIWAYMSFGLDFDDRKILHTADENRESGLVELILWQRAGGGFNLSLFNDYEHAVICIDEFDFDAVHTLSFSKKSVGIYLVFDGMPYTLQDFTLPLEKHMGDNAGNTYLGVGGLDGYEFTNLKIAPLEQKETPETPTPDSSIDGSNKLGDTDISDKPAETDPEPEPVKRGFQFTPFSIALLSGIAAILVIAIVVIILVSKHKKKPTDKPADSQ